RITVQRIVDGGVEGRIEDLPPDQARLEEGAEKKIAILPVVDFDAQPGARVKTLFGDCHKTIGPLGQESASPHGGECPVGVRPLSILSKTDAKASGRPRNNREGGLG